MATYKVVMRPALEYASSIWSPLASSTNINKRQVMQNAALRTATGCKPDTNIQHLHDETLTLPIHEHLQLYASQFKHKTRYPSYPPHKYTIYSKAKTHFNNARCTTNITASLVVPLTNSEQINHPFSNHTYAKSTPNHIHYHYAPFLTLAHTTRIIFSTAPIYVPRCHPWICGQTVNRQMFW